MPNDHAKKPSLKSFGPYADGLGLRMVHWKLDACRLELDVELRHRNGLGVVHGAVYAAMIDVACAHAGIYCTVPGNQRSGSTASLNVTMMGAVRDGTLSVTARKRGGGSTLYMASAEVIDGSGKVIAMGEAVCRYARGSEKPEGVPPGEMPARR
jgi:uncharacterized protein (TIGR00369 family)